MLTTTIYLIRHGKCQPNRKKIFRSRLDYSLNATGTRQVNLLAEELKKVQLQAVYSSPLLRTLQTAHIICKPQGLEPSILDAFNNMNIGSWEGKPQVEIAKKYPEEFNTLYSRFEEFHIDGAETLTDVQKRATDAVKKLVILHTGTAFAIVSHHTVLIPLFAKLLKIPAPYFGKFNPANASYTLFEYTAKQGYTLKVYNQTKHLDTMSTPNWLNDS